VTRDVPIVNFKHSAAPSHHKTKQTERRRRTHLIDTTQIGNAVGRNAYITHALGCTVEQRTAVYLTIQSTERDIHAHSDAVVADNHSAG